MFARIALRTARIALVRSLYSISMYAPWGAPPTMRFSHSLRKGAISRRARKASVRPASLLETALARAKGMVPEIESPLCARSRKWLEESTLALG